MTLADGKESEYAKAQFTTWGCGVLSTVRRRSASGPEIFRTCLFAEAFLGVALTASRGCMATLHSASEPKLSVPRTELCSRASPSCSHCYTMPRYPNRKAHSP